MYVFACELVRGAHEETFANTRCSYGRNVHARRRRTERGRKAMRAGGGGGRIGGVD